MFVIFAEKPDFATKICMALGGTKINDIYIDGNNYKRYNKLIHVERKKGYLEGNYKGKDYIITWGYGHLCKLRDPKEYDHKYEKWNLESYPIIPLNFQIKVREEKSIKSHFNLVKNLFNRKDVDYIVNACDSDREGNVIFDYIYKLTGSKVHCKRFWNQKQTLEEIRKDFDSLINLEDQNNFTAAGKCRAESDWLIGLNGTVLSSLKFGGYHNVISIGRVQTPTLNIIVERQKEIDNFKPEKYYNLKATFKSKDGKEYEGKLKVEETIKDKNKAFKLAENLKKSSIARITEYIKEDNFKENNPLLYNLNSIQFECDKKYGMTPQTTLDTIQNLYEKEVLTYPRTSSRYLSSDMVDTVKDVLEFLPKDKYGDLLEHIDKSKLSNKNKRVFDNSKVDSHYALIPVEKEHDISNFSTNEKKVYGLIVRRFIQAFMSNAIWEKLSIKTSVGNYIFATSGKNLKNPGFKLAEKITKFENNSSDKENDAITKLPVLRENEEVIILDIEVIEGVTKCPKNITQGELVTMMTSAGKLVEDDEARLAMSKHGLGTDATRASIIGRLLEVGYLETKVIKKREVLIPTEKAKELMRLFPVKEIKSPEMTGQWEYKLTLIEKGELSRKDFMQDIKKFTLEMSEKIKALEDMNTNEDVVIGTCPMCGGRILERNKMYSCENWNKESIKCQFKIFKKFAGKKITAEMASTLLKKGRIPKSKGFVSNRTGKKYSAALILKENEDGLKEVRLDI